MKAIVEAAGLSLDNVVFVNPYLTEKIPANAMNKLYAKRFQFGNSPARATIEVTSLPEDAQIEFTGVAVRDLTQRLAVPPEEHATQPYRPARAFSRATPSIARRKADLFRGSTAAFSRRWWICNFARPCEICWTIWKKQA